MEWIAAEAAAGQRLDVHVADQLGLSRAEGRRLCEFSRVTVDSAPAKPSCRLRGGELVSAAPVAPSMSGVVAESITLDVVYEDAHLLVINKPRGMVVHPSAGHVGGTLVNAVLAHSDDLSGVGGEMRPGIVHRLDKDTSGLLVVAKSDQAHHSLQAQIAARSAQRRYTALLWGVPKFKRAAIDAPIGRHPGDRKRMAVIEDRHNRSRDAVTHVEVQEPFRCFCVAEARLETGRTHQIRVHCAYVGHPVVGDPLYGGKQRVPSDRIGPSDRMAIEEAIRRLNGQALHARFLAFDHPLTGERMEFSVPPPSVMSDLVRLVRDLGAE